MRIDELSSRYVIPGFGLDPTGVEPEESDKDYKDAPYSQMPAADVPSPGGWQALLGLNQVSPGPGQIDPPTRPASFERGAGANAASVFLGFSRNPFPGEMGTAFSSPKVGRMRDLLALYQQAEKEIRARSTGGGR
jgi:hypothetical protein